MKDKARKTYFRCGLCNYIVPENEGKMVKYDEDTDLMICKMHI
jgi:hypothetical protein